MESTQSSMTSPSTAGPSRNLGNSRSSPPPPPIPPQCHSTNTDQWGWRTVSPAQLPMMSYIQNAPPSGSTQNLAQNQYYSSASETLMYPPHRFLTPSAAAHAVNVTQTTSVTTSATTSIASTAAAMTNSQAANLLPSQYMFTAQDAAESAERNNRILPSLMPTLATISTEPPSMGLSVGPLPTLQSTGSRWTTGGAFNDVNFQDPFDILREQRNYPRQWTASMTYLANNTPRPSSVVATPTTMGESRVLPNMAPVNLRPTQRSSELLPPVSLPPMSTDYSFPDGTIGSTPAWTEWIIERPVTSALEPPATLSATVDPATLASLQNSANRTTEPLPVPSTLAPESMILPQPVPTLIPTSTMEPRVRDGPVPVESSRTPRSRPAPERTSTVVGNMARTSRIHRISLRNPHSTINVLRPPASEVRDDGARRPVQQPRRADRSPEVGAGESSNARRTGTGGDSTPSPPTRRHRNEIRQRRIWRHRQRTGIPGQSSHTSREDFDVVRAYHVLRGTLKKKPITRPDFIESGLESVDASTLNEEDGDCQICYEPFNERRPEGNTEVPVRLPTCKHLFGNLCIAKWLQDSHQCPYCRAELPRAYRITSINKGLSALLEYYNPVEEHEVSEIEQLRWLDHGLIYKLSQPDCEELIRPSLGNHARNAENRRRSRQDSLMESLENDSLSDMEYDESDEGGGGGAGGGEPMNEVVIQHNAGEYNGADAGGVEERERRSSSSSSL